MQTLYVICTNQVGQISVDVFSGKHPGIAKWRTYFAVTPASVGRLREVYRCYRKRFYIRKEWSTGRWRQYQDWCKAGTVTTDRGVPVLSLDYLQTKAEVK